MSVVTKAEVISIIEHTDEIREYILKPEKYRRFEAGMFLQLTLEDVSSSDYWPESRPFSIASYYNEDKIINLIIKRVGYYTGKIFKEVTEGSHVTIKYAYGDFLLPVFDKSNEIICLAAGTGVTPYFSFIEALEEDNQLDRLKLFYTAKKYNDFLKLDKLKSKLNEDQLFLYTTQENNDKSINRRMSREDVLKKTLNKDKAHYYICGTPGFNKHFKAQFEEEGLKNIHLDEWE